MDAAETIHIRDLDPSHITEASILLGRLNPETPAAVVRQRIDIILEEHPHYRLLGAFSGQQLVGVCGAWIATKIWCGRYLEIDNLVVDPECRSSGVGTQLIRHLEKIAYDNNCTLLVLDSYTNNHPSHRLYHRLGFEIWGFHFIKPIGDWSGKDSA